jgi:hypothetical protein
MGQILKSAIWEWGFPALVALGIAALLGLFDPSNPTELFELFAVMIFAAALRSLRRHAIRRQIDWQEKHDISLVRVVRRWLKKNSNI